MAEHLPEVAMDNRYAALPLGAAARSASESTWQLAGGYMRVAAGELELAGPMIAASRSLQITRGWQLGVFGFVDELSFSGGPELRPLDPQFSNDIPLSLPADALYENFGGSARDAGLGALIKHHRDTSRLGPHAWFAGLVVQRMALLDYRADYRLLSGPDTGVAGTVDYSGDYDHVTPFAGLELERSWRSWSFEPRVLVAVPLPRRPVDGHITGPAFDVAGDTSAAGHGTHFGDPSLTLGLGITYEPYRLTLDLGSTLTQALLEPLIHKGIDQNWMAAFVCRF